MPVILHIWGPGFGLPSVDPQCLAAVLYLQQTAPLDEWILVASSDDTLSPTRRLPALQDDDLWVGGFENIVDHLRARENRSFNLDGSLSPTEKAEVTAFTSHILTHGPPLLDAYLFVSSENYHATTRSAYSSLLQWPMTWTVTPTIHAQAKSRTDYLGFSSLDLRNAGENETSRPAVGADVVPKSFQKTSQSLSSLVKRSETASHFKLEALTDRFLRPLDTSLREKTNLISQSSFSTVDCVACAYLALILKPQLPQPWLREFIDRRYPRLRTYLETKIPWCFQGSVTLVEAMKGDYKGPTGRSQDTEDRIPRLPWRRPESRSYSENASGFAASVVSDPFDVPIIRSGTTAGMPPPQAAVPLLFGLLGAVAAIGGYLGYAYNEAQRPKQSLSDMGEAGALLSSLDFGMGDCEAGAPEEGQPPPAAQPNEVVFYRH